MSEFALTVAEINGYETGLDDLYLGRWDGDNAIPPSSFINRQTEWYFGYIKAFRENGCQALIKKIEVRA